MTAPLGIGVIGAGGISHSHLLGYRSRMNRDLARVVAIADVDEARAREQAKTYSVENVFTDWRELVAHPGVQAVSVCTPPYLHVEQSCAALRAGKHVLCEKPVSATLAGIDQIAAAERESGAVFSGVFQHRFGQGARQVKALIQAGHFGQLQFGLAETLWERDEAYYAVPWRGTWATECGGATTSQAIHSVDMLTWLMGEPVSIMADAATVRHKIEVEDTSGAVVRFANGAMATITVTVNAQDNRSRLEVFGSELQAVSSLLPYDPTAPPFRFVSRDAAKADAAAEEARRLFPEETKYLHVPVVRDFLGAILDGGRPLVTADECRRSMHLLTGLYKSSMTGARVELPMANDDPWYSAIPSGGAQLRQQE